MAAQMRSAVAAHPSTAPLAASPHSPLLVQMQSDLHDLCQPLTALQFHLETSRLFGDCESSRQAIEGSLHETRRLFEAVDRMRNHLLSHQAAGK